MKINIIVIHWMIGLIQFFSHILNDLFRHTGTSLILQLYIREISLIFF
jgi:hypothetical protein